jgi:hypothetical protein
MAYYLSNKQFDCQYWNTPSYYRFVSWAKEGLIMDCITSCAADGKQGSPDFWMADTPYNQVLCGVSNNSLVWVGRYYEQFICTCIGCIWGGGDPPVIG